MACEMTNYPGAFATYSIVALPSNNSSAPSVRDSLTPVAFRCPCALVLTAVPARRRGLGRQSDSEGEPWDIYFVGEREEGRGGKGSYRS